MKKVRCGAVMLVALALTTMAAGEEPAGGAGIKTVTYAELGRAIRDHRGKVVIVDFWYLACVPCRKEFPKLVDLQNRYRKDGLVAVTVNVDDPSKDKTMGQVRQYLKDQKTTTMNFNISREEARRAGVESYPAVFVFDRDNHWVKRLTTEKDEVDYTKLEPEIVELLKK